MDGHHLLEAAGGLGLSFAPPDDLAAATLHRLFPWAPADADPWPALPLGQRPHRPPRPPPPDPLALALRPHPRSGTPQPIRLPLTRRPGISTERPRALEQNEGASRLTA